MTQLVQVNRPDGPYSIWETRGVGGCEYRFAWNAELDKPVISVTRQYPIRSETDVLGQIVFGPALYERIQEIEVSPRYGIDRDPYEEYLVMIIMNYLRSNLGVNVE